MIEVILLIVGLFVAFLFCWLLSEADECDKEFKREEEYREKRRGRN